MKWGFVILAWVAVLILELIVISFIGHPTHCYQIGFPSELYVSETDTGYKVFNEEEYQSQFTDFNEFFNSSGIWISCRPQRYVGPWWDVIELYTVTWYMADARSVRMSSESTISNTKRAEVFDAIVEYATADPYLAQFTPGKPPLKTYYPENFIHAGINLLMFFGIPTAIAMIGDRSRRFCGNESQNQRRRAGLCIHCAYDCNNLPSPTCPECGQEHMISDRID